jgi:hypothetical protein
MMMMMIIENSLFILPPAEAMPQFTSIIREWWAPAHRH